MRITRNQKLFNREIKRIERIAKAMDLDVTLRIPSRISRKRIEEVSRIKPRNIREYVKNDSSLLTVRSSVDRTGTFLERINTSKKSHKHKRRKSDTGSDKKSKQKKEKRTRSETEREIKSKVAKKAKELFDEQSVIPETKVNPNIKEPQDNTTSEIQEEPTAKEPEINDSFDKIIRSSENLKEGDISADGMYIYTSSGWVNRDTGELAESEEYGKQIAKWMIAKDRIMSSSSEDSKGSEILMKIITNMVSEIGEEELFSKIAELGDDFWDAIDETAKYRDNGETNFSEDISADELSYNIELIEHYLRL